MSGTLIAVANMKGGVGKTTTVVSLAEALAADTNEPVLVIDLDPQASASIAIAGDDLLVELFREGRTLETFLEQRLLKAERDVRLRPKIRFFASDVTHKGHRINLSLLACGPHLRITEREILIDLTQRNYGFRAVEGKIWDLLNQEFSGLRNIFGYIILDCAPGISPVTEAAIRTSDVVIVPTIADFLSVTGLNAFCRSLWGSDTSRLLPEPKKPHVLVTRWQQNVRQQQQHMSSLSLEAEAADAHFNLFKTRVPQSAALAEALTKTGTNPTLRGKYGPPVVTILTDLIGELKEVIACHSTSTVPPSSERLPMHPMSSATLRKT
jgi:chromosome partitioning protein